MTQALKTTVLRLPRHPHRFRLARAGIHQVWQYDETFLFGDGRLVLRGKNGAGKSKALEMLLPFLLDGDPRRIDATGAGKTTLRWLMLDGWTGGTNRLGYLWLEFARTDEAGRPERITLGVAIKASTSTGDAKATYFVTPLSAVDDLALPDPSRRPGLDRLRELVRPENCFERAVEYRVRVARDLFAITDLSRYRNLTHLLHGLRRPTIGDRIEAGELVKVLTEALPPLDDDVLDEVARNLDDLDTVRNDLARLERTDAALTTFLRSYRGYLRGVLRGRVGLVRDSLTAWNTRRRAAADAERILTRCQAAEKDAAAEVGRLDAARATAAAERRAIHDSAAYRALDDLRERRATVDEMGNAARAAWHTAELTRDREHEVTTRLGDDAEDAGGELNSLRGKAQGARRLARETGVGEALLGEPPVAALVTLAAASTTQLTDADGNLHDAERPAAQRIDPAVDAALTSWRSRLGEAGAVVKARQRAADALHATLEQVTKAQAEADTLARDVGQLETRLAKARNDAAARGEQLIGAAVDYSDRVWSWALDLSGVDVAPLLTLAEPPGDTDVPVEERAPDRELPRTVHATAHELLTPVLAGLDGELADILTHHRAVGDALAAAVGEKQRWEQQTDPERPASPYAATARDPQAGAPLYLLVDFADSVAPPARVSLEAALQASGLLDGWVRADGAVLAAGTQDVVLRPGGPAGGPSLSGVLRPALPDGCPVAEHTVARLLGSIGLGESEASSWVASDGRWRLGVAHGAYTKPTVEYVGAGARAATRARRVAELTARIETLTTKLDQAQTDRASVEQRRGTLRRALRDLPDGDGLTAAWTAYDAAVAAVGRCSDELTGARRQAEAARAAAVKLRDQVAAQATADGLPAAPGALAGLRTSLDLLRQMLGTMDENTARVLTRLQRHQDNQTLWEQARNRRLAAERDYGTAHTKLDSARRELRTLEHAVGASEQAILAQERDAKRRVDQADTALPGARATKATAHDNAILAKAAWDAAVLGLAEQEQQTVETSVHLRRPLGLPGTALAAELGDLSPLVEDFDAAQTGSPPKRIAALKTLADGVEARLGPSGGDVGDSAILRRGEELRDGLAGGFDAAIQEVDGIKRFELHDDVGVHDVAVVGQRIRAAAQEARDRLSSREQEVFERYLLGELGDHLARQVLTAQRLVAAMNETLHEVRSSHGIGAQLAWQVPADADADVKAAVGLLRQPSALRTRDQSTQLRAALHRRIEDARLSDPSAGYSVHLRAALDYRSWFSFVVRVTDKARPDRERVLSRRTALSQGEQRVVSYVVLFAAAAAHFSSIGAATPTAPRLILLDDAFAKVDEPTHGNLLGLLVDLDLDFICTSERLWGFFSTVPSLHVYECLRDPAHRGVATVHYTWDGQRSRLVSV